MQEYVSISLFEVVGSPLCIASSDGQVVYRHITSVFENDRSVLLSFQNVSTLTAAFLNSAIGQLYGVYSEEKLRSLLKVEDIDQDDLALVKRVVENAKQYFKDPERFRQAYREVMCDED